MWICQGIIFCYGVLTNQICCLSLLRCVDNRGSYKPSAAITWLYCLLCRILLGRYVSVCQHASFPFLTNPKHFQIISATSFCGTPCIYSAHSVSSGMAIVLPAAVISYTGCRAVFSHLFICFQKEKCWSERDIDRSWARRGLWLWHLKVIFLPTAASPPPWLGWVLKIAHWGRYPNPTVTMSAIKNSWLCNVKHGKGQWDNTGHGCEWSAGHHLWSWYIEKYLSL